MSGLLEATTYIMKMFVMRKTRQIRKERAKPLNSLRTLWFFRFIARHRLPIASAPFGKADNKVCPLNVIAGNFT